MNFKINYIMKKVFLFCLICGVFPAFSQNIVGTWKRTSSILEYVDGKTDDLQKNLSATFPCSTDIKYVFESGGKHYMILPKGCESFPKIEANWTQTGNKFFISQKVGKTVTETNYELSFSGKIMTMIHTYTPAEGLNKTKRLILKYEKL